MADHYYTACRITGADNTVFLDEIIIENPKVFFYG